MWQLLRRKGRTRHGEPRHIAIIGRGLTGMAATVAILRQVEQPVYLWLIDCRRSLGGGLAFGQAGHQDLLNVRARDLSAFPDEPGDFAQWLNDRFIPAEPGQEPSIDLGQLFMPRNMLGDYMRRCFVDVVAGRPDCHVQLLDDEVVAVGRSHGLFELAFEDGGTMEVEAVVLATGYGSRKRQRQFGIDPYLALPEIDLAKAKNIAIVGSGLSMVDTVLALRRRGYSGELDVVSRHGRLPQCHTSASAPLVDPPVEFPQTTRELFSVVRAACLDAVLRQRPWQSVINSLRPHVRGIWQSLPADEQRRFLRHLNSVWISHRHRLAPDIHAALYEELRQENTRLRRGGVVAAVENGLEVVWSGENEAKLLNADLVFDCSGYSPDLSTPVFQSLLELGHVERDGFNIGLSVEASGAVLVGGKVQPGLFALGPLGVGSLMEITAAPEIIAQAEQAATAIGEFLELA